MPLQTGAAAPSVEGLNLAKPTVLYFYPKDDTPGCTKEACEFRDTLPEFTKLGVQVVGVSTDTSESHLQFVRKYDLSFTLLADPERAISKAYGVLSEKGYAQRVTYLIRDGIIRRVFSTVNPVGHSQEVLTAIRQLK